jgi:hypothetical protein
LDLYEGHWQGTPLRDDEFIISTDEKTSIQARRRCHTPLLTGPNKAMRIEHEYERMGSWAYLAAWDVRRAKIYGRCERKTGIVPFGRLMNQVMTQEPYRSAGRVFWIMDNGSSHRGQACVDRTTKQWPTVVPVHTPVHASWLNQVEVYFSILERKALTPNDFPSLEALEERLHDFARREHCEAVQVEVHTQRPRRSPGPDHPRNDPGTDTGESRLEYVRILMTQGYLGLSLSRGAVSAA